MSTQTTFDAQAYKTDLRREWREAAPGWQRWLEVLEADGAMPQLGRWLLEAVQPRPGDRILDVGTGYGEPGLTAARAVAPGGHVTLQDLSDEMLALAHDRVADADLRNVEVDIIEGDADELTLPAGRLDAVISRSVLMYLADPAASLARLRAGLRPGGRLAASTWSGPEDVTMAAPVPIIRRLLDLPAPPTGQPGLFALADPQRLHEVVTAAGFAEVELGTATAVFEFTSPDEATRFLRDCAPPVTALVEHEPLEVRERVWQRVTDEAWEPYVGDDGRVRLPNLAHCVTTINPR
jgi:enediyne biosynthesis protein CalE5